jgi:hypothetical protein
MVVDHGFAANPQSKATLMAREIRELQGFRVRHSFYRHTGGNPAEEGDTG